MSINLTISTTIESDDLAAYRKSLHDYNEKHGAVAKIEPLYILLRDEDGNVVAGLDGSTSHGYLYVSHIAVHENLRHQGYGTKLMHAAEDEARKRGCHAAHLGTYSFQALPFYQKLGYTVYGTLDDYPIGHQCHYLTKKL